MLLPVGFVALVYLFLKIRQKYIDINIWKQYNVLKFFSHAFFIHPIWKKNQFFRLVFYQCIFLINKKVGGKLIFVVNQKKSVRGTLWSVTYLLGLPLNFGKMSIINYSFWNTSFEWTWKYEWKSHVKGVLCIEILFVALRN